MSEDRGTPETVSPAGRRGSPLNWRVGVFAGLGAVIVIATAVFALAVQPEPVDPDIAFADVAWAELIPPGSVVLETRAKRPPPGKNLVGRRLWLGTTNSEDEVRAFYSALLDGRPG